MKEYVKKTVLIVEDDGTSRKLLRRILRNIGFEQVEEAESGEEAPEKIKNQEIELVLADWHMSGITGLKLLKLIRAEETFKHIQFLMVTSESSQANVLEAVRTGVNGYIMKPFSKNSVLQRIEAALKNTKE